MKKLLCILIVMLLITGCGSSNENNDSKKESESTTTTTESTTTTTTTALKKLKTNDKQVKNLIDGIKASDISTSISGWYYEKDKITVDKVDNQILLLVGMQDNYSSSKRYISASKVEASIKKVFGDKVKIKHENIDASCNGSAAIYEKKKNRYDTNVGGCGGMFIPFIREKITRVNQKGDTIEIYQKAILVEPIPDETESNAKIFTPSRKKTLTKKVKMNDKNYDKYLDKSDEYKFTFVKEGNRYVFSSVEKV